MARIPFRNFPKRLRSRALALVSEDDPPPGEAGVDGENSMLGDLMGGGWDANEQLSGRQKHVAPCGGSRRPAMTRSPTLFATSCRGTSASDATTAISICRGMS